MPITDAASLDLTLIWAFVLAFSVFVYVVLDGFDLGLGMLFALEPEDDNRDLMMNSIAPVWDGNETWLVLGGGGLMAAFPLAYALILPALYIPLIVMLLALVFRGVAFEFRGRGQLWKGAWDAGFIAGSAIAAFAQGVTLGGILQGIEVDKAARAYVGGPWDWLTPFSVTVGVAVMAGYMLLGATWLLMKVEGELSDRMRHRAWVFGGATVAAIGVVSLWTPFLQDGYFSRWFTGWGWVMAGGVAIGVLALTLALSRALRVHKHDYWPFIISLGLFLFCFAGLGGAIFPYIVPSEVTIYEAAAPRNSQIFMLIGTAILIPIILAYTSYTYWVFRGKVSQDAGYH